MARNGEHAHIWAHFFGPYLSHFRAKLAENYYGNSEDYNLTIGGEKSKL